VEPRETLALEHDHAVAATRESAGDGRSSGTAADDGYLMVPGSTHRSDARSTVDTIGPVFNSHGGGAPTGERCDGIVDAFDRSVERRRGDALVVSPDRRATLGEIDALSRAAAARLETSRLDPASLIGLAAPNGPAFLAGFLAIRRAGHAALLLDHSAPLEDRQRVLEVLGAPCVLACDRAWPTSAGDFQIGLIGAARKVRSMADVAVVKLTSGSTGAPRGVAMDASAQLADASAFASSMGLRPADRFLAAIPFSHAYGFTILALSALVRGSTLVLPADWGPFPPLAAGEELGATVFPTVPAYVDGLLKMSRPPALPSRLRLVISAGATLPKAVAARFRRTYRQAVHVLYGASECGGICYDREGSAAERGTVGTPLDGVRLSIEPRPDERAGVGVVVVESLAVGRTYLPEPDPRLAAGRFETSDVGTLENGELVLRRRVDRVINVRGRKVDPTEVEGVLAALDGVVEAVVVGVAAPGRDEEIVRAVVACPSGRLAHQDVLAWCRPRLAEHKVPRSIILVEAIPRTARGKVDRAALLDPDLACLADRAGRG
jgi:acyl-coenzyme A synthetase/AMP-(fatty) acid ligase